MSRLLAHYSASKTAFLCCDLQSAFASRIPKFANCVFVANRFASLHNILTVATTKYIVTEHYPKALGKTVPEIALPPTSAVFDKTLFSMVIDPVRAELHDVDQVVLFGIEAHVCVLQTIESLLEIEHIKRIAVCRDGVGSQKPCDEDPALALIASWGPRCYVTSSESVMFQLIRDAKDPKFKKMSELAKMERPQ